MADSSAMGLVLVETFPVAPLGCNCAIVADPQSKAAIVLDPGGEPDRVLASLARHGLNAVALVHTHAHLDHCLSSARLSKETGAPILMHAGDLPLYGDLARWGDMFGLTTEAPGPVARTLGHGERVTCGGGALEVLHTPGHTLGASASGWRVIAPSSSPATRSSAARSAGPTSRAAPGTTWLPPSKHDS